MSIVYIKDESDLELQVRTHHTLVLDFYAEWCSPCKALSHTLEDIDREYGDELSILKIDVERSQDLSNRFKILSLPTIAVLRAGVEVARLNHPVTRGGLSAVIENALGGEN